MVKNKYETIRKIVNQFINQDEGFYLPNIQRHFVWKEEQIEKLFDSIMREYPIGSLLVWKTQEKIQMRNFIKDYRNGEKLKTSKSDNSRKYLVLDGQQRLQALYISLKGTFNKKELYFNILSGEKKTPEEISYEFKFKFEDKAIFPWIKFKDIVLSNEDTIDLKKKYYSESEKNNYNLNDSEKYRIEKNISKVQRIFASNETIIYQEMDSVDNKSLYELDDIVEVFIRANSGGTPLNKSDLIFSLLTSRWEEAEESMDDLLQDLNRTGYNFSRDFILKTCLTLLNKGARYNVDKVRKSIDDKEIEENWSKISNSIKDLKDFIYEKTFLKSDHSIPSYLLYIPLIYYRFHYFDKWKNKNSQEIVDYILRTSISGSFSGTPDNLIDKCIRQINIDQDFILSKIFEKIKEDGRNINISKEELLNIKYGSSNSHIILNILYKNFNYTPIFNGNQLQQDHIFPQSILKNLKEFNPESNRNSLSKFPKDSRDQLANLALLTFVENGSAGKSDSLPDVWFSDKTDEYLDMHLIPKDKELWKVENFDKFIEKRKELILAKLEFLLI
ncbi:MAG: DUF262 domain-containing protein [Candidatus Woesearchaeota archaeon]